jgi:glycosyltransferase involved in cell wall biosynthesis
MKIAVLNNHVPFVTGGAEYLADALVTQLQAHGHRAALYRIPFQWTPPDKIVESMLACRLIRLSDVDRVIALKFPVYYVPHDHKVLWLLHQFRQVYDLWGTPLQDMPDTDQGRRIRDAVVRADNAWLPEARAIYSISHVTGDRLRRFNQIESQVLWHPHPRPEPFHCEEYGDFIFCPSRITRVKRQNLLVEAMRHTRTQVRLVIAGAAESAADVLELSRLVEAGGLGDRVRIQAEFITDDAKVDLFARALACAYLPLDEDSYGYVTLEAYHSRKPVISCRDSGGIGVVVKHGQTGYLVDPEPSQIAEAMDELYLDRGRARALGEAGFRHVQQMGLSWEHVVSTLTA